MQADCKLKFLISLCVIFKKIIDFQVISKPYGNYSENNILLGFIYLAIYIFFSAYQRPHLGCITVKASLYQGRLIKGGMTQKCNYNKILHQPRARRLKTPL